MSEELCRDCGYYRSEEVTCKCGRLVPRNELAGPAGLQLSEAMMAWSRAWKLDGDLCRCRKCNRGVIVSRAAEAFRHAAECPQAHLIAPWQDLRSRILANEKLSDGSPTKT